MITAYELTQRGLFAGLTEEQVTQFIILAEEITCAKGKRLFDEGEPAHQLYILLEGRVSIQVQLSSRPEQIGITTLNQFGQLVGWS